MIIGAEIGLLIYGIYVLIKGEYSLGKGKKLRGGAARLCGGLCLAPIPIMFIIGFIMGFVMIAGGGDPEQLQRDINKYALIIELAVLIGVVIFVTVLAKSLYNKQEARDAAMASQAAPVAPPIPAAPADQAYAQAPPAIPTQPDESQQ